MIDEALVELLRPLVQALVKEEVGKAQLAWHWMPVKRAAELLQISEAAVRQRVQKGQLPGRRVDGRVYVDMAELDRRLSDSRRRRLQ